MSDSTTLVYKKKKKKFKIFPLVNAIFFIIVACLIMIYASLHNDFRWWYDS